MGVQNLWELLQPVGRTVDLQTLANRRYAVDASIWIVQVGALRPCVQPASAQPKVLGQTRPYGCARSSSPKPCATTRATR